LSLDVVRALQRHGFLSVGAADNVVRLLPPLIIGDAEIKLAGEILDEVASETGAAAATGS